jgi:membrane-bound lytic murein transglycosylase B
MLAIAALSFVWMLAWAGSALSGASKEPSPFDALKKRLVQDGLGEAVIKALYARPEVSFDHEGITSYFSHRESTLNYDQFSSRTSIAKAGAYLDKHGKALQQARKDYGVDSEIVAAILLVESRLGTFIGKRSVFNTLSNLAAIGDTATRDMLWNTYVKDKTSGSKKGFDKWASRKSAWAYRELKAFLKYTAAERIDPVSLRGSYAGALGFAQFVPSSVLKFGKDGNKDGQINLYDHGDAIESIANYLKRHGWKPDMTRDEAFRVLLRYNNSKYYANTILEVADRLSKVRRK